MEKRVTLASAPLTFLDLTQRFEGSAKYVTITPQKLSNGYGSTQMKLKYIFLFLLILQKIE